MNKNFKGLENNDGDTNKKYSKSNNSELFSSLLGASIDDVLEFIYSQSDISKLAIVLSYLPISFVSKIISNLNLDITELILLELINIQKISNFDLEQLNLYVDQEMKKIKEKERRLDGIEFVTGILRAISSYDKKAQIINRLKNQLPDITEQITKRMFIFTDIAYLNDRVVQRIIKEIEFPILSKALKTSDIIIQDKIFKNLSKRKANQLRDELDFMGKISLIEVEESQNHILKTIMHLKEMGEINISYEREYV